MRPWIITLLLIFIALESHAQVFDAYENSTEVNDELVTVVTQLEDGSFQWQDPLYDDWMDAEDWSHYRYSSVESKAGYSLVKYDGKLYDPLSFKGGFNDTYGMYNQLLDSPKFMIHGVNTRIQRYHSISVRK